MSTGWQTIDPPPVVAAAAAVAVAAGDATASLEDGWRRADPPPVTVADVTVAAPAAPAAAAAAGGWVVSDPSPVVAVGTVASTSQEHTAQTAGRRLLRTLTDLGTAPVPGTVMTPTNAELFRVVEAVARRNGVDHATVEVDAANEGVRIGIGRFALASGEVGLLLRLVDRRDPTALRSHFGEHADALLRATTAERVADRLVPVGDTPLWAGRWPALLHGACSLPPFRYAQNELAVEHQVKPLVPVVSALGGTDGRALALAYDRALRHGVGGAVEWLVAQASPLTDDATRDQALARLGLTWSTLRQSTAWLPAEGGADVLATAELTRRLRRAGGAPSTDLVTLLTAASDDPARAALLTEDAGLRAVRLGEAAG